VGRGDISPPYPENWEFLKTLQSVRGIDSRGLVLTATNKDRLDEIARGDSKAIQIVGKTYNLQQITTAITVAVRTAVATSRTPLNVFGQRRRARACANIWLMDVGSNPSPGPARRCIASNASVSALALPDHQISRRASQKNGVGRPLFVRRLAHKDGSKGHGAAFRPIRQAVLARGRNYVKEGRDVKLNRQAQ
jgi:hypothetical protein